MQYLVCNTSIITLAHIRELLIHKPHHQLQPGGKGEWESDEIRDRNHRVHLHNDAERVQHHIFTGTLAECQTFKEEYARRLKLTRWTVVDCLDIIKHVADKHPHSNHLNEYLSEAYPHWNAHHHEDEQPDGEEEYDPVNEHGSHEPVSQERDTERYR